MHSCKMFTVQIIIVTVTGELNTLPENPWTQSIMYTLSVIFIVVVMVLYYGYCILPVLVGSCAKVN